MTRAELDEQLRQRPFVECGTLTARSSGWVAPCPAADPGAYVVSTPDLAHWHIRLKVQEKNVPGKVVKAEAARRAAEIEKAQYFNVVVMPKTAASPIRVVPVGSFGLGMPPEGRKTYWK